jgi:hypothetical protein
MDESAKKECYKLVEEFLKPKSNSKKRLAIIEKLYHIIYEQDLKHPHYNTLSSLSDSIFWAYYTCQIPAHEMQRLLIKRVAVPANMHYYFSYMNNLKDIAIKLKTVDEPFQPPQWDWWKEYQ